MTGVPVHDAVGVVRPCLCLQHLWQPFALGVGVVPEVEEKEQENQAVQADDVDEDGELVGTILDEEILGDVAAHHDKLYLGSNKERRDCYHMPFNSTIKKKREKKRDKSSRRTS